MSVYLDASVLVASLTRETRSHDAKTFIRSHPPLDAAFSSWTLAETVSGLAKKVREGSMSEPDLIAGMRLVDRFPNAHSRTPIAETHFLIAQRLSFLHQTGLRAGDALHLAIAADYGLPVVTFDKGLASAAQTLKYAAILL